MTVQNKLYPVFSQEFWQDIDRSISFLVRDLITGRDVSRLALELRKSGVDRCTDSLLYKWANPNAEQAPSLKQFLLLTKICENCGPIDLIAGACGLIACPDHDYREGLRHFDREFEKRERLRPGPGVREAAAPRPWNFP